MGENVIKSDIILDKKLEESRYSSGNLINYVAAQELTVTITLEEYRELVASAATKKKDIDDANNDKYARNAENEALKKHIADLKAENYDLKTQIDAMKAAATKEAEDEF